MGNQGLARAPAQSSIVQEGIQLLLSPISTQLHK